MRAMGFDRSPLAQRQIADQDRLAVRELGPLSQHVVEPRDGRRRRPALEAIVTAFAPMATAALPSPYIPVKYNGISAASNACGPLL